MSNALKTNAYEPYEDMKEQVQAHSNNDGLSSPTHTFIYSYILHYSAVFRQFWRMIFRRLRSYRFISADQSMMAETLARCVNVGMQPPASRNGNKAVKQGLAEKPNVPAA